MTNILSKPGLGAKGEIHHEQGSGASSESPCHMPPGLCVEGARTSSDLRQCHLCLVVEGGGEEAEDWLDIFQREEKELQTVSNSSDSRLLSSPFPANLGFTTAGVLSKTD